MVVIKIVPLPLGSHLAIKSLLLCEFQLGFLLLTTKNLLSNIPDYGVEQKHYITPQSAGLLCFHCRKYVFDP